jgi:glycosyltransferase involved in cell wall biosynthesis
MVKHDLDRGRPAENSRGDIAGNRQRPLLSIVVPSYNQAQYIAECLAEPIRCRALGVEVIVIDGGSSDGTKDLLEKRAGELDHWVSEKDRGQAHAINKGFVLARGEWVAFQNSDDYYLPGKLEDILALIRIRPKAEVILGGMLQVDAHGIPFRKILPKPILRLALARLNFVNNQALFIRRSLLDRVGPLDEGLRFCLDHEWFVRIFNRRPAVLYVPDYIGAQRYHETTKTANLQHVHDEEFKRIARTHFSPLERFFGFLALLPYMAFRYLYGRAMTIRRARLPRASGGC